MLRARVVVVCVSLLVALTAGPGAQQTTPIRNADVNADGIVSTADLATVQASLGKRCGQAGFNAPADTNGDCVINAIDAAFVSCNLGQRFPPTIETTVTPAANANGWYTTRE
jgi:hypothetical protein